MGVWDRVGVWVIPLIIGIIVAVILIWSLDPPPPDDSPKENDHGH